MLYDGWPLVYAPASGPAIHLLELLEALPACVEPWLALPGEIEAPEPGLHLLIEPIQNDPGGRLRWEQAALPALARRCSADLLHTSIAFAPLLNTVPCVISPAEKLPTPLPGLSGRLREALGRGGAADACILWPEDLPDPPPGAVLLPPYVHSAFFSSQPTVPPLPGLPETYVFVPGPLDSARLPDLAAAWSWVSAGIGENGTLLAGDLSAAQFEHFVRLCREAGIETPIEAVNLPGIRERADVFQNAAVILLANPVQPWGDSYLQALACARPLAAAETPWADRRIGPAGYLVPAGDARGLGAAVLTPLVEEPVAEQLSRAAAQRTEAWGRAGFSRRLGEVYADVAQKKTGASSAR